MSARFYRYQDDLIVWSQMLVKFLNNTWGGGGTVDLQTVLKITLLFSHL